MGNEIISVFTKPWKKESTDELIQIVHDMGFNGIEYPLRDGYQVEPKDAGAKFPAFAEKLRQNGVEITSVASSTDEAVFAACAEAKVGMIRVMPGINPDKGYMNEEDADVKNYEKLLPLCQKYNVKVGLQQHYGNCVFNSMELRHMLEKLDKNHFVAIWDAAHSGLAYENPVVALDQLWDYLYLVNLKNAYVKRIEGETPQYVPYFTTGKDGASNWESAVKYLKSRGYGGVYCMPAEYDDFDNTKTLAIQDVKYLKDLLTRY
jgi:sugar phosphate isomerase/epimerase